MPRAHALARAWAQRLVGLAAAHRGAHAGDVSARARVDGGRVPAPGPALAQRGPDLRRAERAVDPLPLHSVLPGNPGRAQLRVSTRLRPRPGGLDPFGDRRVCGDVAPPSNDGVEGERNRP